MWSVHRNDNSLYPMLVLTAAGINNNPALFVIASFCLTYLLAESFS